MEQKACPSFTLLQGRWTREVACEGRTPGHGSCCRHRPLHGPSPINTCEMVVHSDSMRTPSIPFFLHDNVLPSFDHDEDVAITIHVQNDAGPLANDAFVLWRRPYARSFGRCHPGEHAAAPLDCPTWLSLRFGYLAGLRQWFFSTLQPYSNASRMPIQGKPPNTIPCYICELSSSNCESKYAARNACMLGAIRHGGVSRARRLSLVDSGAILMGRFLSPYWGGSMSV